MPTSRLPLDIKNFLIESIDSVSHLEVLLMLFKNPSKHYSASEVSHEQRSNHHSASNQLEQLTKHGLLKVNDAKMYQYAPGDESLHEKVKKLQELYKEMPVAVVTCIYDKPKDKLKDLSDAFKLKKD